MYESFIETLPLLTSLEVWVFLSDVEKAAENSCIGSFCSVRPTVIHSSLRGWRWWTWYPQRCSVIHSRLLLRWQLVFMIQQFRVFFPHILCCCCCANSQCLQGDLADCFYIVESGQVRITIKRSRVSLTQLHYFGERTKTIWNLTAWIFFSSFERQKKTRRRRRWILRHSPEASISGSWRSSPTSPELHQPMPWEASNAWVHYVAFRLWKHVFL